MPRKLIPFAAAGRVPNDRQPILPRGRKPATIGAETEIKYTTLPLRESEDFDALGRLEDPHARVSIRLAGVWPFSNSEEPVVGTESDARTIRRITRTGRRGIRDQLPSVRHIPDAHCPIVSRDGQSPAIAVERKTFGIVLWKTQDSLALTRRRVPNLHNARDCHGKVFAFRTEREFIGALIPVKEREGAYFAFRCEVPHDHLTIERGRRVRSIRADRDVIILGSVFRS
jgi:hypothetical protein